MAVRSSAGTGTSVFPPKAPQMREDCAQAASRGEGSRTNQVASVKLHNGPHNEDYTSQMRPCQFSQLLLARLTWTKKGNNLFTIQSSITTTRKFLFARSVSARSEPRTLPRIRDTLPHGQTTMVEIRHRVVPLASSGLKL